MPGGRPISYTPEELYHGFTEYKANCDSMVKYQASAGEVIAIPTPFVYTLEDFCQFINIHPDTLNHYGKNEEYSETVKKIRAEVFARKQRALVNAEGSTTGLIFDMKANYGINEKNYLELNGTMNINTGNLSDEELINLAAIQSKIAGQ